MHTEPVLYWVAPLTGTPLAAAAARVFAAGEQMGEIRLHPIDYADLLILGEGTLAGSLSLELRCELTRTGVWPTTLYGAEVIRDVKCEAGTVLVCGCAGTVVTIGIIR